MNQSRTILSPPCIFVLEPLNFVMLVIDRDFHDNRTINSCCHQLAITMHASDGLVHSKRASESIARCLAVQIERVL
jgi:hypothetical protein